MRRPARPVGSGEVSTAALLTTNQGGTHHGNLEALIRNVRAGRGEILSGDRALALKRFKEAREYWMTPAKKWES